MTADNVLIQQHDEVHDDTGELEEELNSLNVTSEDEKSTTESTESDGDGEGEGEDSEDQTTLFVSGFPLDVKYREIHNLFRLNDGFRHCVLNLKGRPPTAFATFGTPQDASLCRQRLHGLRFDEQNNPNFELRIQLARQNSKARNAVTTIFARHNGRGEFGEASDEHEDGPPSPSHIASPVTTLFVANLGINATEEEVRALFMPLNGIRRLCFSRPRHSCTKGPVAFVDFVNVESALFAIGLLQGCTMPNSKNVGGMRLQFAKKNMGHKGSPLGNNNNNASNNNNTTNGFNSFSPGGMPMQNSPMFFTSNMQTMQMQMQMQTPPLLPNMNDPSTPVYLAMNHAMNAMSPMGLFPQHPFFVDQQQQQQQQHELFVQTQQAAQNFALGASRLSPHPEPFYPEGAVQ